eukprot:746229-Hanusia_phi.AAC.4
MLWLLLRDRQLPTDRSKNSSTLIPAAVHAFASSTGDSILRARLLPDLQGLQAAEVEQEEGRREEAESTEAGREGGRKACAEGRRRRRRRREDRRGFQALCLIFRLS